MIAALALSACGGSPEAAQAPAAASIVRVSLPDEPATPWAGAGGALIERNCAACHSVEMIANQPPLDAKAWQATIDKMRAVYAARIARSDDPALVTALIATQAAAKP